MYPNGCLSGLYLFKLFVTDVKSVQIIDRIYYFDQWGTRSLQLNLTQGKLYTVTAQIDWHFGVKKDEVAYRDFNFEILGPNQVQISELTRKSTTP